MSNPAGTRNELDFFSKIYLKSTKIGFCMKKFYVRPLKRHNKSIKKFGESGG